MIVEPRNQLAFSFGQNLLRWCALGAITLSLLVLHTFEPARVSQWIPLQTSCGAFTGLPCLFCGTTRALHFLLNGEFSRALYFNWIAFPLLAFLLFTASLFVAEIIAQHHILLLRNRPQITATTFSIGLGVLTLLWIVNAYLAVSQHKQELLNPAGPLYAFFVR